MRARSQWKAQDLVHEAIELVQLLRMAWSKSYDLLKDLMYTIHYCNVGWEHISSPVYFKLYLVRNLSIFTILFPCVLPNVRHGNMWARNACFLSSYRVLLPRTTRSWLDEEEGDVGSWSRGFCFENDMFQTEAPTSNSLWRVIWVAWLCHAIEG